jgi:hypothetical protein
MIELALRQLASACSEPACDETGRDLIPLTAAEARRLFNMHTRVPRRSMRAGQTRDATASGR